AHRPREKSPDRPLAALPRPPPPGRPAVPQGGSCRLARRPALLTAPLAPDPQALPRRRELGLFRRLDPGPRSPAHHGRLPPRHGPLAREAVLHLARPARALPPRTACRSPLRGPLLARQQEALQRSHLAHVPAAARPGP
ncbi:hypothetical protein BN1708_019318, partial [Verticillium longisporum]